MPMFSFNNANNGTPDQGQGKLGPLAGSLGALGSGLFSDYTNPVDKAMPYYNQIPGTVKPYYDPYIQAGQRADPTLESSYNGLVNNPQDLVGRLSQGYQQSPGYQFNLNQQQTALKNLEASKGMLYSPEHEETLARLTGDLANQDYDKYLGSMLDLYFKGLGGLGGISDRGYGASTGLADILGQNLQNQGQLAYVGQVEQNQASADRTQNIGQGLGGLFDFVSSYIPKLPIPGFG